LSSVFPISYSTVRLIDVCSIPAILNTVGTAAAVAAAVTASDPPTAAGVTDFMTSITLDNNIQSDLEKASKFIGVDERELVERAIVHYIHSIRDEIELAEEFEAWDRASDEALMNMERELTNGA
jgi:hypothetical protein